VARQVKQILSVLIIVGLASCAVPRDFDPTGGFIPNREVKVVGLTREGLSYYKQSRFVDAELKLRQALYLAPDADNLKNNLALALLGSGQVDDGEAILLDLAKKYPQSSRYYNDLGEARSRVSDYEGAIEALSTGLERAMLRLDFVAAATLLRSRAVARFGNGDEEDALCNSMEALALKNDPIEQVRHARALLALNRFADAKKFLLDASNANRALQQDPDVLRHLALAHYGLGEYQQASDLIERALDLSKALPDIQSSLRVLAEVTGSHLGAEPTEDFVYDELGELERLYWPPNLLADYEAKRLANSDT
jgi:tetratricopeptide (TPR) repeat protein